VPELPGSVPPALAAVVRRALAKDPAQRYPDGTAFAAAVREALVAPAPAPTQVLTGPVAVDAGAVTSVPRRTDELRERARRVPVPVWAVAGVFVVIVVVAAAANLSSGDGGGGAPDSDHTPSPSATHASAPTSTTPSISTPTTPTTGSPPGPAKPPKKHGHKGKGHQ
jgi:serine/threonine-protein kinase